VDGSYFEELIKMIKLFFAVRDFFERGERGRIAYWIENKFVPILRIFALAKTLYHPPNSEF